MRFKLFLISLAAALLSSAQSIYLDSDPAVFDVSGSLVPDEMPQYESVCDSVLAEVYAPDTVMYFTHFPRQFFLPAVFNNYEQFDTLRPFEPQISGNPAFRWLEEASATAERQRRIMQNVAIADPAAIKYNSRWMPEPYKVYEAVIDPQSQTVTISEALADALPKGTTLSAGSVNKRHWIRSFDVGLQFSQAYVSPNWYQGGNNNINALFNLYYNVKLNTAYHPDLIFETTFQYRLGMNNAPNDTVHNYNISEDIFQINTLFGYKAVKRWYYSVTGLFKTQVVNSYGVNSHTLRSAFFSPAELNIGLGMTYNYANPKKTFSVDLSISPLTYNMKMCTNPHLNVTSFGIEEGKKSVEKFGSSAECKLSWKITYNINLNSRFFAFTDYDRAYFDWENTIVFDINKYLSTKLFWNMRYDTDTPRIEDSKWKKFQMREIFSIGFSYKFSTT